MRDLSAALRNQPPVEHAYDGPATSASGSIQSYGVLLVADRHTRQISFASENAVDLLGIAVGDILEKSYLSLCDNDRERRAIRDAVAPDTILFPNPLRLTIKGRAFDAVFHTQGNAHLIEVEPADSAGDQYLHLADKAVEDLFDPGSVEELYQRAVKVVRNVTGFDRVMLYRFDTRYNGQVLAESTRDGIGSFLGLYFPSRDISPQARDLYLRNFTRYIPDIGAPFHALHSAHGLGSALSHTIDLSYANLRNVQACHIDYLKNMGVQASMSFSINVDNRLWGLFACHHYAPKLVSYEQRVVCEQTAMMFIYKLTAMSSFAARTEQRNKSVQRMVRELEVGSTLARRIAALDSAWGDQDEQKLAQPMVARALAAIYAETSWLLAPGGSDASTPADIKAPESVVGPSQQALLDLVEADSAAIIRHGQVYRIGNAPETMAIYAIASMFGRELPELQQSDLPVFATDNLTGMVPVAAAIKSQAAGVLAVALSDNDPAYLLWFRGEQVVHATWAGNPIDEKASGGATDSNPRASFAAWQADIRDLSKPWVLEDVEVAYQLVSALRRVDGQRPRAQEDVTHALWPAQQTGSSPIRDTSAQSGAAVSTQSGRRIIRVGQF